MIQSKTLSQGALKRGPSRRETLARSTALFGAFAASVSHSIGQADVSDVSVLNYLLGLENLEAAFYLQGLSQFSSADFANSALFQDFGSVIGGDVYAYLSLIRDHERQHVLKLKSLIASLGGTPPKPAAYNFVYKTADQFFAAAASLENTGVTAYVGALYQIQSPPVRTAAANLATVEARHASYLNLLTGTSPGAAALDKGVSSPNIQAALAQFVTAS